MSLALLITTYNRSDALDRVLESVNRQSRLPDEVVVADDGSSVSTIQTIQKWQGQLPLKHTWLPDAGFRAARSRNLSILKTESEYIVMVDGDCVLPPTFLDQHLTLAKRGMLVAGGRHLFSDEYTQKLLSKPGDEVSFGFVSPKFWSLPMGLFRNLGGRNWKKVRSCNLGVWRSDLLEVGGFDEVYVGWGREDSDLVIRLLNKGVLIRSARFAACVGHLHHPDESRDALSDNTDYFEKRLNNSGNRESLARSFLNRQ